MKINIDNLKFFKEKMQQAGVDSTAQHFFSQAYLSLNKNEEQGYIPESTLEPIDELPCMQIIKSIPVNKQLLNELVVIKLNGGLGTSMGLDKPKSFVRIKEDKSFLDLALEQIIAQRKNYGVDVQFLLLNSFNSSKMTLDYLREHKQAELNELGVSAQDIELLQNQVPRIDKATGQPAIYPQNTKLEWNPPGHGDIYTKLYTSGKLEKLIKQGKRYAFISNMDNLGAIFDPGILSYIKERQLAFVMEVCERSKADKKGGHLARDKQSKQLILREKAQCLPEDLSSFEDIEKYQYFNTNNLWVDLRVLLDLLIKHEGVLPLNLIQNEKQIDPANKHSPRILQLETAMGSAISCYEAEQTSLLKVGRERFMPVKTVNDWWLVRSDAYTLNAQSVLTLNTEDKAPLVDLGDYYKYLNQANHLGATPSLRLASNLSLKEKFIFEEGVIIKGDVSFINNGTQPALIEAGVYENQTYRFN